MVESSPGKGTLAVQMDDVMERELDHSHIEGPGKGLGNTE